MLIKNITWSPSTLRRFSISFCIKRWESPNSREALARAKPELWYSFPYLQQSSPSFLTGEIENHICKSDLSTGRAFYVWSNAELSLPISNFFELIDIKPSTPRMISLWKCCIPRELKIKSAMYWSHLEIPFL